MIETGEIKNPIKTFLMNDGTKYKYYNPYVCTYPRSKAKIVIKKVVFENPSEEDRYTIALVDWTDKSGTWEAFAFRWNVTASEMEASKKEVKKSV